MSLRMSDLTSLAASLLALVSIVGVSWLSMPGFSSAAVTTTATSTPAATAQKSSPSGSSGSALGIGLGVGAIGLGVGLGIALSGSGVSAAAGLRSFGGRVLAVVPCVSPLGPSIWATVVQPPPKQPSVIPVIWTPATITRLWGPPKNPGQQILGTFDTPIACVLNPILPPFIGFRMTEVGTSLVF